MVTISVKAGKESLHCVTATNNIFLIQPVIAGRPYVLELLVYLWVKGTEAEYTSDPALPHQTKNKYWKGTHKKDYNEPLRNYYRT